MNRNIQILLAITAMCCSVNASAQKMSPEAYLDTGRHIWQTYVPKSGQAKTVQGELLRAIEKLADEAQRNGNVNFNANCHTILIAYLRQYLVNDQLFPPETIEQIKRDLDTLSKENEPYLEEDLYDRLRERIIDWYLKNKTPIPHKENPKLRC